MRKRKKGPVLLLAVLLMLSGCGNAEAPETGEELAAGNSIETTQEASAAEEAEQEDESEESSRSMESEEAEESSSESGEEESREPEEEASASATKEAESSEPAPTPTPTPEPTEAPEESTPAETPAPEASAQTPESTQVPSQAPAATPTPAPQQTHSCTWDGGTVTQAATCTAEGIKTYTCTSCGNTRTESIPKTDHSYAWLWPLHEDLGNCTERYRLVDICANCGYILNTYADETLSNHKLDSGVKTGGPLCVASITTTYTCQECGYVTYSVNEGPVGHQEADWRPGGYCMYCGEHLFHKYVEGKCYCGAVQEGYTEEPVQTLESGEQTEN